MVWSLLYGLTRNTFGVMLLRVRGDAAKDMVPGGQPVAEPIPHRERVRLSNAQIRDTQPRESLLGSLRVTNPLRPLVIDPKGKVRRSLPKPTGVDDPDQAADALTWFNGLRKELRPVSTAQISRLERAMITQRPWSATEFRTYLVEHPLLTHLARRLLWTATDVRPGVPTAFRVAEDLTFADVADEVLELPDTAVVRLAHPVLVEELEAWAELFADYEILQPFAQLGRTVGRFSEAERQASELTRFVGATMSAGRLMALRHRGWETPDWYATRHLPGGTTLRIRLNPGIQTLYFDATEMQSLIEITLEGGVFGNLEPVTASELLADLELLTRPTEKRKRSRANWQGVGPWPRHPSI